jgi:hypothetical protein
MLNIKRTLLFPCYKNNCLFGNERKISCLHRRSYYFPNVNQKPFILTYVKNRSILVPPISLRKTLIVCYTFYKLFAVCGRKNCRQDKKLLSGWKEQANGKTEVSICYCTWNINAFCFARMLKIHRTSLAPYLKNKWTLFATCSKNNSYILEQNLKLFSDRETL